MLNEIKNKIGYWLLNRKASKIKRNVKFVNLYEAKEIALIVNIESIDDYKVVSDFIKWLRSNGKQVFVIAFVKNFEFKEFFKGEKSILFFSKKNITSYGKPKNIKYNNFITKEFDILIDLTLNQFISFHYLVVMSKAKLKVGKYGERYNYYDFVIDLKEKKDLQFLINQIKHYLCEINKSH